MIETQAEQLRQQKTSEENRTVKEVAHKLQLDEQADKQATGKRQASDGRPTTNIEGDRKKEGVERLASLSPPTSSSGGKASE